MLRLVDPNLASGATLLAAGLNTAASLHARGEAYPLGKDRELWQRSSSGLAERLPRGSPIPPCLQPRRSLRRVASSGSSAKSNDLRDGRRDDPQVET